MKKKIRKMPKAEYERALYERERYLDECHAANKKPIGFTKWIGHYITGELYKLEV